MPVVFNTTKIKFTDKTLFKADSWSWDFGDGQTSTDQSPTHTYSTTGLFTVTLVSTCGSRTSTKTLDIEIDVAVLVIFEQYDGPFVWPGCVYTDGVNYYSTYSVSGENRVKYSPIGTNPANATDCVFGAPITGGGSIIGVNKTVWSGSIVIDPHTCVSSGILQVILNREGGFGAYDFPGSPGSFATFTGTSIESLFNLVFANRGTFGSGLMTQFNTPDSFVRRWYSPAAPGGYFAGSFGGPFNSIWCQGYTTDATYSNLVTIQQLGYTIARTGDPARLQTITSFDPVTRTLVGNKSRMRFPLLSVDATKPFLNIDVIFLVTPSVGAPYNLTISTQYPITGPTLVDTIVNYPQIVGATVYAVSWAFSYFNSVFDDFELYVPNIEYTQLTPIVNWNAIANFLCPPPNTNCWDDYEQYSVGPLASMTYGYRWNGDGTFFTKDPTNAYDDFESYPIGSIIILSLGVGWSGPGGLGIAIYYGTWDDFESYATGAISALTFNPTNTSSSNSPWSGNGVFFIVDYTITYDDFESYPTGAITALTFTVAGDFWTGNGIQV
jgi:PKD repeat protein